MHRVKKEKRRYLLVYTKEREETANERRESTGERIKKTNAPVVVVVKRARGSSPTERTINLKIKSYQSKRAPSIILIEKSIDASRVSFLGANRFPN